ncbi:MAG: DUF2284 domain-containing protein, partial [Desulfobacterales bacterium]|nr:DUF2284 domain-containing protein [Desulfobacterales bacterium]
GILNLDELSSRLSCDQESLERLLKSMESLALVINERSMWFNSQTASRFLVKSAPEYMGHFILYRKYMRTQWQGLSRQLLKKEPPSAPQGSDDADEKFFIYFYATDALIKIKCPEIVEKLERYEWHFPLLDVGGGAGSLLRALMDSGKKNAEKHKLYGADKSVLFDLDDVIRAAKRLYPGASDWEGFAVSGGDFRSFEFEETRKFGLVILSNFLHAYSTKEARELLGKALRLLKSDGILLIHDYFPDRTAKHRHKGRLYDLNMMINTYNGRCHEAGEITGWLKASGMASADTFDLDTDTAVIIAVKQKVADPEFNGENFHDKMYYTAMDAGFKHAALLPAGDVVISSWPRLKCRFGCAKYSTNLKCPPNGLAHEKTRELLSEYAQVMIIEGAPPGLDFHTNLLDLEKKAFLHGYYRALSFIAGPCTICTECPDTGKCRNPKLARPSMEGSGIDVYATCRNAGIDLKPVARKGDYIKYIGMLLLD